MTSSIFVTMLPAAWKWWPVLAATVSPQALAAAVELAGRRFKVRVLAGGGLQWSHLVMEEG